MKKHFKFEGRRYSLVKRLAEGEAGERDASWYLKTVIDGKLLVRSLDTNNATAAAERAIREFIQPAKAGRWGEVDARKMRDEFASVGDVLDAYARFAPGLVDADTARANRNALARLFAVRDGVECDGTHASFAAHMATVRGESTKALTAKSAREFAAAWRAQRTAGLDGDALKTALATAERSGAAYLRCARAVFSGDMMERYRDAELRLPPGLSEWRTVTAFRPQAVPYHPVSDSVVNSTFAAVDALREGTEEERNVYRAWWLCVGSGLRRGEASRARWEEFVEEGGEWRLVMQSLGKDGRQIVAVMMAEARAKLALAQPAGASGYVLSGADTERRETVWRRLGAWMSSLGWTTRLKAHELRAWSISRVIDAHGLSVASEFARHKDPRLTKAKYGRYAELKGVRIEFPQSGA